MMDMKFTQSGWERAMQAAAAKTSIAIIFLSASILAAPALAQNRGVPVQEAPAPRAALKNLYAAVDGDTAVLFRSVGAVRARRVDSPVGNYVVIFDRNITSCFYFATIGRASATGVEDPGIITTVRSAGNAKGVYVATSDPAGVLVNRSFFLHVACPDIAPPI
jgi:hypothetical protein